MQNWTPHPYQIEAIEFALKRDGSGLMLDPGLGKTSVSLAVYDLCRSVGDVHKCLVVAPLRVCKLVWPAEATKWAEFSEVKVVDLTSIPTTKRYAALRGPGDVFVIHPEMLVKLLPELPPEFDMLILDESTKFKDSLTQRFRALRKYIHMFKRRMILTGTPVPNGLQDLFGQMFIVDNGESLGKFVTHFRNEFCIQHPSGFGFVLRRGAEEQIYRRVANRLMRLDAKDHIDLPEPLPNFIPVYLPEHLKKQYADLEDNFLTEIESQTVAIFNASSVGNKLRQLANGFIYDDQGGTQARMAFRLHTEKLDALEELVEEMQGRPLLVAYEFEEDALMLEERFPQVVNLGKVKRVEVAVKAFNDGDIPLAIAQTGSISHGLNLQEACNTVCWYGITWNLEHYIQFVDRVHRQGQKKQVVVHHLVCMGTKDEDVMKALDGKDKTQKSFNRAIQSRRA